MKFPMAKECVKSDAFSSILLQTPFYLNTVIGWDGVLETALDHFAACASDVRKPYSNKG